MSSSFIRAASRMAMILHSLAATAMPAVHGSKGSLDRRVLRWNPAETDEHACISVDTTAYDHAIHQVESAPGRCGMLSPDAREFLNRTCGRPSHRQMGSVRVAKDELSPSCLPIGDSPHHDLNHSLHQRLTLANAQHS